MKAHLACCMVVSVLVLFTLLHLAIAAPKPIQLQISPRVAFAPATLAIRVRVHPNEQDRWILVVTDGPNFYRRSDWEINPNQITYPVIWPNVPAGAYDVVAKVGHGDTVTASDVVSVEINGMAQ